jgi:hypothetical protein
MIKLSLSLFVLHTGSSKFLLFLKRWSSVFNGGRRSYKLWCELLAISLNNFVVNFCFDRSVTKCSWSPRHLCSAYQEKLYEKHVFEVFLSHRIGTAAASYGILRTHTRRLVEYRWYKTGPDRWVAIWHVLIILENIAVLIPFYKYSKYECSIWDH